MLANAALSADWHVGIGLADTSNLRGSHVGSRNMESGGLRVQASHSVR
jgi:hypothetical protein